VWTAVRAENAVLRIATRALATYCITNYWVDPRKITLGGPVRRWTTTE